MKRRCTGIWSCKACKKVVAGGAYVYRSLLICIGHTQKLLWPPCVADADIIFLPCGFSHSSFFLSLPNLSGRRVDVYHTSTHGVALVRI